MKTISIFIILNFSVGLYAQDYIVLKNGDFIKAKVIESNNNITKYRKDSLLVGIFTLKNRDVRGIKYNSYDPKIIQSSIENYNDKIVLMHNDTIRVTILSVLQDNIRYRSKNADNNVTYVLNNIDIKYYQFAGKQFEIVASSVSQPELEVPVYKNEEVQNNQTNYPKNYQSSPTNSTTTNYASKKSSQNLWFINAKTAAFLPVGDFGKGTVISYLNNINQPISSSYGFASIGANFAFEGAYFFGNNIGIVSEFGFSYILTDLGVPINQIPPTVTLENEGWKVFNFASGIIAKTNNKDSFFDFKLLLSGNQISSYSLYLDDSGDIIDLKAANFGGLGIILGSDYKFSIADNLSINLGLDYFYSFSSKYYQEVYASFVNNQGQLQISEGTLPAREVTLQGIRFNVGLALIFGK